MKDGEGATIEVQLKNNAFYLKKLAVEFKELVAINTSSYPVPLLANAKTPVLAIKRWPLPEPTEQRHIVS